MRHDQQRRQFGSPERKNKHGRWRSGERTGSGKRRILLEPLEDRCLLSTFAVVNADDSGDGSLRWAVDQAISNVGPDAIAFGGVTGTIGLNSTLPTLQGELTIQGPGAGSLTVSGNHAYRVLHVASGASVAISGLTIADGVADGSGYGGGIHNEGTLTVTSVTVTGSSASIGGGIANVGALAVSDSTVVGNSGFYGGGIYSYAPHTATVSNSTVAGNSAWAGGGLYNDGTLTLLASTVSGNSAEHGGGMANTGSPSQTGTATIRNSTFSNNSASGEGGGIKNDGIVSVLDSTLSGNTAGAYGGGIASGHGGTPGTTISLLNTILANNSAANGPDLYSPG